MYYYNQKGSRVMACCMLSVSLFITTTALQVVDPLSLLSSSITTRKDYYSLTTRIKTNSHSCTTLSLSRDEINIDQHTDRRNFLRTATSAVAVAATNAALLSPSIITYAISEDDDIDIKAKSDTIAFANKFLKDKDTDTINDPLASIPWTGPKERSLTMDQMADAINDGLIENEWFVTGQGKPELFSDKFTFSDPQVTLEGFENYCRGVRRLFDQNSARCEVVCCSVTGENQITVLWRNSGIVNIGVLSIVLKPYLVTTTFTTDPSDGNLIVSQTDEFETDTLGLLLYQIPLLRSLAGPPAESVDILKQKCDFKTCKMMQKL